MVQVEPLLLTAISHFTLSNDLTEILFDKKATFWMDCMIDRDALFSPELRKRIILRAVDLLGE